MGNNPMIIRKCKPKQCWDSHIYSLSIEVELPDNYFKNIFSEDEIPGLIISRMESLIKDFDGYEIISKEEKINEYEEREKQLTDALRLACNYNFELAGCPKYEFDKEIDTEAIALIEEGCECDNKCKNPVGCWEKWHLFNAEQREKEK